MKTSLGILDATPSKRLYLSIIADYDLKIALCELIDNALDNWMINGKISVLKVEISLDYDRQIISITDNSGGIREEDIKLVVSPGYSKNDGKSATIGTFGVGSKRAVIALGEEIKINTRFNRDSTFSVEINDAWIHDENWDLPYYKIGSINPHTTIIEILKLRAKLKEENENILKDHVGATYSSLISTEKFQLSINNSPISPVAFDSWSYPPDHEPREVEGKIQFDNGSTVSFQILGGLIKSGDPSGGEYGAYFYCNNRLISRAYKGFEVGYRALQIGQPHPSVSIARTIVTLNGPAELMPWNSSKSELNVKHPCFAKLQEHVSRMLIHYSTLAKRWSTGGGWETNVFRYADGQIIKERLEDISTRYLLPSIPHTVQHKYSDTIKKQNKELASEKPWTRGLYEGIIVVNEMPRLKLEQNNRISLIILDNTLEIAFKDFLVYEKEIAESRLAGVMSNRKTLHDEVMQKITFKKGTWDNINYFYKLRCELMHKRASANIPDLQLDNYRATVEYVLSKMFGLNFTF